MWQPPIPISFLGRDLTGIDAWVHVFALTWDELETKRPLCMAGFEVFGAAVAAKHGDEHPADVAQRLFPEAGEYREDIYPTNAASVDIRAFITHDDVPF
ncbi:hypothetical protein ACSFA2_16770 [Variovorax sp. LT2P21]|uniref:hypothetical protein n=1 Tax=Variovorax sp. LT2P21 TaxID=3443731 RepID=UPI003F478F45